MTPFRSRESEKRSASEIPYRDRSTLRRHLLGGVICFVITAATFAVVTSTTLPRRGRDLTRFELFLGHLVVALSSGTGFGFFVGRPLRGLKIGAATLASFYVPMLLVLPLDGFVHRPNALSSLMTLATWIFAVLYALKEALQPKSRH